MDNSEDLYVETKEGNISIDQEIVEKYNLKMGTTSPFTDNRIVGEEGEFPLKPFQDEDKEQGLDKVPYDGFSDDGIDQMDHGFELSTSEIIDISQGVDSD